MDEDMPYYQRSSTTLIVQGHGQDYPDDVVFFDKKLFLHVKIGNRHIFLFLHKLAQRAASRPKREAPLRQFRGGVKLEFVRNS